MEGRKISMYGKALREVYEIIDNMSIENTRKISPGFMKKLFEIADWNYDFEYDKTKTFKEQNLSKDAKTILAIIYMRYFASVEDKAKLYRIIKEN